MKNFGSTSGLTVLAEDQATPANGMVAYVTSSYNSGYQNGDIKGAFLSDTDDTDLVGSGELVTNGTFDTDTDWSSITDWDNGTISGGQITVDTVGVVGAAQAISGLTVGTSYIISAEVVAAPSGTARLYVGSASNPGTSTVLNQNGLGVGVHTFTFVATATSHAVGLSSTSADTAGIVWDNISVKLADEDRSVNG